ncbi:hypothetical protein [Vibrio vulnificus]|uniref:hypothetical protein n=1 Tax=Vibrio vulnificus TaxID=672 RepID=UPI0013EE9470|nr:hypothetical protein [Vibrio vulnificus]
MNHSFDNQARNLGKSGLKFENLKMDFGLRQLSEFPAPKNKCPKNSAQKSQLADKQKTNQPREQRKL